LLQLLVAEPSCASHVAGTLGTLSDGGYQISKAALASAVERVTQRHAPMGHGSEVAWALWMCLAHKVALTQRTAASVSLMDDSVVALLALHAKTHSLIDGNLNTSRWESAMTVEELRGSRWLLSYEARIKAWLPSKNCADHIGDDPFFSYLRAGDVSFYDSAALSLSAPPLSPLSVGGAGELLGYFAF
jgi:hypothetical protein